MLRETCAAFSGLIARRKLQARRQLIFFFALAALALLLWFGLLAPSLLEAAHFRVKAKFLAFVLLGASVSHSILRALASLLLLAQRGPSGSSRGALPAAPGLCARCGATANLCPACAHLPLLAWRAPGGALLRALVGGAFFLGLGFLGISAVDPSRVGASLLWGALALFGFSLGPLVVADELGPSSAERPDLTASNVPDGVMIPASFWASAWLDGPRVWAEGGGSSFLPWPDSSGEAEPSSDLRSLLALIAAADLRGEMVVDPRREYRWSRVGTLPEHPEDFRQKSTENGLHFEEITKIHLDNPLAVFMDGPPRRPARARVFDSPHARLLFPHETLNRLCRLETLERCILAYREDASLRREVDEAAALARLHTDPQQLDREIRRLAWALAL